MQYIENHDHQRFVCNFGTLASDNALLQQGNRDLWYKVQPHLIALLTAKGIPLLWQGQESGENYWLPHEGWGRVKLHRPVRWDYFYDSVGKRVIALVRKLTKLRLQGSQFRRGNHYFYNHYDRYQSNSRLHRRPPNEQPARVHSAQAESPSLRPLGRRTATSFTPLAFPAV